MFKSTMQFSFLAICLAASGFFTSCQKSSDNPVQIRPPTTEGLIRKTGISSRKVLNSNAEIEALQNELVLPSCRTRSPEEFALHLPDEVQKGQISKMELKNFSQGSMLYLVLKNEVAEKSDSTYTVAESCEVSLFKDTPLFVKDSAQQRVCKKTAINQISINQLATPVFNWQCDSSEIDFVNGSQTLFQNTFKRELNTRTFKSKCTFAKTDKTNSIVTNESGQYAVNTDSPVPVLMVISDENDLLATCPGEETELVNLRKIEIYAKSLNFLGNFNCSRGSLVYSNSVYIRANGTIKETIENRLVQTPVF